MILGNDFEFSKDEYTIAEVALGLHHLIFDVLYDIEQEIMELDRKLWLNHIY